MPLKSSYRIAAAQNNGYSMPVKDNHQHGSADLRKEGSYDLTSLESW
jgi:hypothetical protein